MTQFLKRAVDVAVSGAALLLGSPLFVALAVLQRAMAREDVFYSEMRIGLGGRAFRLWKFRTMCLPRNGMSEEQRITKLGKWLRRSSVDELPQLWNVLKGDMSLVGPRPLPLQYLPRLSPEESRRHLVRPGLTGWAQVNGRNSLSWDRRLALDVWYVDNLSLTLDVRILAMTAWRVIRMSGIDADDGGIMEEFRPPG